MFKKSLFFLCAVSLLTWTGGAALAEDVIKIGVPTPLTGYYVSDGMGYRQCLEFGIEEINAQGGLLGKKLKAVQFDIGDFSPEKLIQASAVLVGKNKVDSVHGGWSGWGQNVNAFGRYNVPTFFADASLSSVEAYRKDPEKNSNIYQMCDTERPLARNVFDTMISLPYEYPNKKIAIIVTDDSWGTETGEAMKIRAEEKGWEVAMYEVVPYGVREWGSLLTKIRNIKPAWIHLEIVSPPDVTTFFDQFMESPTQSLINFGYGVMPPDLVKTIGPKAGGILGDVVCVMPLPQGPNPEANAWLEKFRAKYGNDPLAAGYLSYVSLKMWAQAVREVGDVKDYDAINAALAKMTYTGVEGYTWTFDEDHKIPVSKNTPHLTMQIQDGRLVTIYAGDTKYQQNSFQIPGWIK